MKNKIGIFYSNKRCHKELEEIYIDDEIIFFGFQEMAEEFNGNYVRIKLNTEQQKLAESCLLIRLSVIIGYAEAYHCTKILLSENRKDLLEVTDYVNGYVNALKKLVKQGTLSKLEIDFPYMNEGETDVEQKKELRKFDYEQCEILFSGGIDCSVATYIMVALHKTPLLVNFSYGQSNYIEEKICCENIEETLLKQVRGTLMYEDLSEYYGQIKFSSGLLQDDVILEEKNKKMEYVPFRNTIFFAFCIYQASREGIGIIISGSQKDDSISPDNCEEYYKCLQEVIDLQRDTIGIKIVPILHFVGGKADIVKLGTELGVDFKYCWTCHSAAKWINEIPLQCGVCSDCATRYSAFIKCDIQDPLMYVKKPSKKEIFEISGDNKEVVLMRIRNELKRFKYEMGT